MRALLDYLGRQAQIVTVYDYSGTPEQLAALEELLHGYGARLETADTDSSVPADIAVFHQEGSVLGACGVDSLLAQTDFERVFESESQPDTELLAALSSEVRVKPALTVTEMIRISRDFERRALREGSGELHAGFQQLSQIANSDRTVEMYTALADEGVDVSVYGVPDVSLDDVPFAVVEDEHGELEQHWFLLYDGDGNPDRKAALVSEECPTEDGSLVPTVEASADRLAGEYDSYFTTDPATVDELFELAGDEYDLLRLGE
jgi:hypothetical protein